MGFGRYFDLGAGAIRSFFKDEFAAAADNRPAVKGPTLIPSYEAGQVARNPFDPGKFGEEGYRQCVVIFVCCVAREAALNSTPLILKRKSNTKTDTKETITDHPLLDLLSDPINSQDNPESTGREFASFVSTSFDVAGNTFVEITRSGVGLPARLDVLSPLFVKPVRESDGTVKTFKYENGTIQRDIEARNMLHFKNHPDFLNPWLGLSPIAVAARSGDLDNRIVDYMVALMLNGAIPFGELTNTLVENVPIDTVQDMKAQMRARFTGKDAGNILVHGSAWTYAPLSVSPKDMMPMDFLKFGECRIAASYRVPIEIVGVLAGIDAKYENYNTARIIFYDNMEPTRTKFEAKWTQLARDFDPLFVMEYDLTKVRGLNDVAVDQQRLWLDMYTTGRALTLNELREKVGFPTVTPAEGGDTFFEPLPTAGQLTNSVDGEPKALPAPRKQAASAARQLEEFGRTPKHTQQIHRAADTSEVLFRKAFTDAISATKSKINSKMLVQAIADGDFNNALDEVPWNHFQSELSKGLEKALTTTLKKGAGVALGNLSNIPEQHSAQVDMVFDGTNPEALAWIDAHGAELVTSITDNTREAIKDLMRESFAQGVTPQDTAKQIEQYLGLNAQQSAAVSQRIGDYLADGSGMSYALERGQSYASQLIRKRALNIARTESIIASNKGQEMLWNQAVDEKVIDATRVQRKWILTDDDRLCPECSSFEGAITGLNEMFISKTGIKVLTPGQVHPQDRCTQGLVYVDVAPTEISPPPIDEIPTDNPVTQIAEDSADSLEAELAVLEEKAAQFPAKEEFVPWINKDNIGQQQFTESMKVNTTVQEYDAIEEYQGSGYEDINGILRDPENFRDASDSYVQDLHRMITKIDNVIAKSEVPENVTVFRGADGSELVNRLLDSYNSGGFFEDQGFVSTSLRSGFSGAVQMEIDVPAGTNATYIYGITENLRSEQELLLPRGSQFIIYSAEKITTGTRQVWKFKLRWIAAEPLPLEGPDA